MARVVLLPVLLALLCAGGQALENGLARTPMRGYNTCKHQGQRPGLAA